MDRTWSDRWGRRIPGWVTSWWFCLAWPGFLVALGWSLGLGTASPGPGFNLATGLVLATGATDAWSGKIFNKLTYPSLGWGLILSALATLVPQAGRVLPSEFLSGMGVGLVAVLVLHDLAGGGMGDAKLAAALGGLAGPERIVHVLVLTYLMAGLFAPVLTVSRHGLSASLGALGRTFGSWVLPMIKPPTAEARVIAATRIRLGPFFALAWFTESALWPWLVRLLGFAEVTP